MRSTYAFPLLESHDLEVLLYTRGASESWFGFLTPKDQEALLPCHPQKGKIYFHLKAKPWQSDNQHAFLEVVLRFGKLNGNNLDMLLCIAMSCILRKQPEKK